MSYDNGIPESNSHNWNPQIDSGKDRRFAFRRQCSAHRSNSLSPLSPSLTIRSNARFVPNDHLSLKFEKLPGENGPSYFKNFPLVQELLSIVRAIRTGNRPMRRLFLMISLNATYSVVELILGLFTGRVGLISDAFHLTFGCGLLTFSLFAMAVSCQPPDRFYTYGCKRLEVLAAFTNSLFLLFLSFSLAVEALHAFMQDESEHKHYLVISAVINLVVNLVGVWFFRSYARVHLVYNEAEDMNHHSICLHVLADSIRSAGLILASWLLSLGVQNAEILCLGLVSSIIFLMVMPLFKTTGGILLQMAPKGISSSAFNKSWRQTSTLEGLYEISQARFWQLDPGHLVGSLSLQVKKGADDDQIIRHVCGLYNDFGIHDLTIQTKVR